MPTTESAAATAPTADPADSADGTGRGRRRALTARLVTPMPADRLWGWLLPLAIAVLAGLMRFWRLGEPGSRIFDEVYYAKGGWQLLNYGVEYDSAKNAAEYVVHPPAGKWTIAVGQWLFGNDAFGWRFTGALLGTLAVLMIARVARRMTRSTLLGCAAGLLLAFDGLAFVSARTALLDGLLMVFTFAGFGALVADRDAARARLARLVGRRGPAGTGPGLGLRPWRLAAGLLLGVACATKWSGIYFIVAFGLMTLCWDVGARRAAGMEKPWTSALRRDAPPAFASLVVVPVLVYLASWTGWFLGGEKAWDRYWAADRASAFEFVPEALRSLWHYHAGILEFHTGLDDTHPYQSHPWGWLVLARPVSYYFVSPKRGDAGCQVESCAREVLGLGTPVLWWAAVGALLVTAWLWLGRRDWRGGAVLAGVAAGYLPWFLYAERTVFSFYTIVFLPYLVLALTLTLGVLLGPPGGSPSRRRIAAVAGGVFLLLVVLNFGYLYPVLSAETIPYADWHDRMWFKSWI